MPPTKDGRPPGFSLDDPDTLGFGGQCVPRRAANPFRAFTHRNFRLYLLGQGVSIIGSWMQQIAMAWLVYEITGSPLWLGITGFAGQIPALFLTPLAGCLIDRVDRRRLLFVTQTIAMTQAIVLALLTLSGIVESNGTLSR